MSGLKNRLIFWFESTHPSEPLIHAKSEKFTFGVRIDSSGGSLLRGKKQTFINGSKLLGYELINKRYNHTRIGDRVKCF